MVAIRYREKSNADVEGELGGRKWPALSTKSLMRIPGTADQSGLLQIRYYVSRTPHRVGIPDEAWDLTINVMCDRV